MRRTEIDFMGKRRIAAVFSILFVTAALIDIVVQGINPGLDFTGGTLVEVQFPEPRDPTEIRQYLEDSGFEGGIVQYFGSDRDVLVRMPPQQNTEQADMGDQIIAALQDFEPGVEMLQSNYVGPAVGEELRDDAGLALIAALGAVMLYILFRFTKQFAVGAVVALIHDIIVVIGCFSLFQLTFDLSVLAAVLAVIGYSLNDTIVVSDRIRENFRLIRRATPLEVINRSLNQTLGRTLVTSLTTLLVLVALLVAGGETIQGFALALTIGIVVGTYSSIYVAANVLVLMNISREDLLVPEKEGEETEAP
ncbi:MAG: protein translocase subunit SecF [Gammaproteobacteria bacterium]|mgnify:CR=1 FL=1|nr:protein translocase subunit SecF [Gammaproteobacteria bacterium]MBK80245.1 protein translocase subunit SecF [Gammaproteobacteria bacterium]|tara:strand:+ start:4562 stop:5482 length:921 start_codon:yes stop_codon:yes gene_type:complete